MAPSGRPRPSPDPAATNGGCLWLAVIAAVSPVVAAPGMVNATRTCALAALAATMAAVSAEGPGPGSAGDERGAAGGLEEAAGASLISGVQGEFRWHMRGMTSLRCR